MTADLATESLGQLDFYWDMWRPRLDGLTDEEYFWEPVDGCWSVRPADGGHMIDWSPEPPEPPPFTTIAWRLCHVASQVFDQRATNHFGDGSYSPFMDYPATADAALDYLDRSHRRWRAGIGSMDAARWSAPVGSPEGPYGEMPYATLVLHLNRELFHHGAEIALLRDLYRASNGGTRFR